MPSLVFLVEDNPNSLYYTKRILETNNYEVITADNGKTALNVLSQLEQLPEIIISDIMMPKMDGYDFFRAVTEKPILNQIPFLFLSALDKPEDIRFGKILGVDDYITKPFEAEDLIACVAGKIARNKKIYEYNKMVNKSKKMNLKSELDSSLNKKDNISLLLVQWDDLIGPNLIKHYTENVSLPISIKELGQQLYQSAVSIYGQDKFGKAEG
ncbi:MAG: response regulator, partial [Promethearchaeota archaeon]